MKGGFFRVWRVASMLVLCALSCGGDGLSLDGGSDAGVDAACPQSATCSLHGCSCQESLCDDNFPGARDHTLSCCALRTALPCRDKGLVCHFASLGNLEFECTDQGTIHADPWYCEGTGGRPVGGSCTANVECTVCDPPKDVKGTCVKQTQSTGQTVVWPGGYCQAPCDPARSMPNGSNPACQGDAVVCLQTSPGTGTCMSACSSVGDCRPDYACMEPGPGLVAVCVPAATSECDPASDPAPQGRRCPNGQQCQPASPDNSFGRCR